MVRPIYVPQAGRFVNFSDTASNEDIKSYIRTNFPKPQAVAPPAQEEVVPTGPDQSTLMQRGIYGLVSGFTEIPGGIAALMYPAEEAAQTAAGKWSAGNRAYLQKQLNIDPTKEASTGQMLAQGLGSAVGFLIPGGAVAKGAGALGAGARAAGLAGAATVAGQGASLNAGARAEKIQGQLASGMEISPETQLSAQRLDGLIGLSEALPMHKFFGPIGALLSKVPASKAPMVEKIISSRLTSLLKAGTEEAAQEAASNIASDIMEYGAYNPDVQIGEDIVSNAAGGAFAGTVLEGVIQIAAGRKLRGARQLHADLRDEEQKNNADARRVNIAMASEELARAGVEGPLKVEENEAPDGNIRHTIMTPEGKPLADMQTADDAVQAIDLYKKKTGANVSVDVTTAPNLNPIRIGASRFPTIEAAAAEYEKIKGHVVTLEKYAARPDLIQKEAEKRNVPIEWFKRQVADSLAYQRKRLTMFNAYFTAEAATAPVAPAEQAPVAPGPTVATEPTTPPVATAEAPVEAPTAEAPVETTAEVPVEAPAEVTAEIPAEALVEETPEPITSEEQVPEMPIGAVEMPIEESRVLPDTIVDNEFVPESGVEPPPVRVEKRPSASPEELMNLRTELFGSPIGWHDMTPDQKSIYEAERDKRFPPQDVTLWSAGITKEPVPKTVRDATITGPMVKDYSEETQQWIKKVYDQLVNRLGAIAPTDTSLRLKTLAGSRPGYLIRGQADMIDTPNGLKSVIDLSTGILKPDMSVEEAVKTLADIMNHEVIHVLRDNGLIRPNEWRILTRAVANTNVPGKKYTYLDKAEAVYTPMGPDGVPVPISDVYKDPDAVAEEAVAEMYREWVVNRNKPKEQNAVGLLNRITEFFRRIFQTFRNARYEEFFSQIESGEIGGRKSDGIRNGIRYSAGPVASPGAPMSDNLNDRNTRAFDLYPYLRSAAPRYYEHKRKILGATNPGNAAEQIRNLDGLLSRHTNTLASNQAFADYLADAMGKLATAQTGVPIVPYAAVMYANNPHMIARQLERMTPGQLAMAEEGLNAAKDFESAYRSGTATPVHTAKLILWGILSRGVSPFVQESMFLDVVKPTGLSNRTGMAQGGIDQFINDAVDGEFDLDAYMDYVKTLKVDGLPGAGTTHNLGAFGKTTLVKLQQRVPDGRTILQYLHDLISDYSLNGKEIRRRFHEVNPGIGINNKVLSFMMLVSGRDDVLVLDRVQMRNQFNDGRFDDYNLYDGEKIEKEVTKGNGVTKIENVTDSGTGIAHIGDGVFGLMYYEALERDLAKAIRQAYTMLGRSNQFSMGRYHWESWVATSSQEVDHGSVTGLIKEATGEDNPYGDIYTGEGKYDTFNSGIRYGYTREGEAYVALPDGLGRYYFFTPEYAKKVIKGYAKRSTGIISDATFKVSESTEGPWYDRPEVNKERLRQYLRAQTEVFKNERRLALSKRISEVGKDNANGSGPGPVHAVRRRGGVRQPVYTHPKETSARVRFSAAPLFGSDEFKRWFKNSVAVNPDGTPTRYYHGTPFSFTQFSKGRSGSVAGEEGPFFFSQSPEFTEDYSLRRNYAGGDRGDVESGGRTIPVYLSVQNPFDYENPSDVAAVVSKVREMHNNGRYPIPGSPEVVENKLETLGYDLEDGDWPTVEKENIQRAIRELGYDGFFIKENKQRNLAVFRPEQAKSIFNQFGEGAAASARFSAAPTPAYLTQQNNTLFKPAPQITLRDTLFNYVFGHSLPTKTVRVNGRDIEISGRTMKAVAAKAAAVDNAAYLTELEKIKNREDTGNYQRQVADYSATAAIAWLRRASHVMASMMLRGNLTLDYATPGDILSATMKVTDDPDSLKEVFKVMTQPAGPDANGNPQTKADIFKQYAVARRGEWLKASGQTVPREITPQYVRETIAFTQREYPEVVEAYNMYQRFNKKLMTTVRDAGLISNAELGRLTNQMNYYGFIYEAYGEPLGPSTGQKAASQFKLRPYTGTQHGGLVNDPMFVMIQNAQFMVTSVAKNLAAVKSFELAKEMGEARILKTGEAPNEFIGEQKDTMFFSRNGQVHRFAVKDPLLVTALGSDDRISVGKFWEVMGVPAHILRESVTRDPGFMARNLLRDTLSSWITSGVDILPIYDTVKNFGRALKDSPSFQALGARGVVGSYDLAMQTPQELAATFKRNLPKNVHGISTVEQASNVARSLWNRLGHVSEASDAATRMAVYDALIAQGASEAEAAMQAIELLDFTRRGGSQTLGILTKLIPFLNARIQGMDVLYQAGRAGIRYATGKSLGERDANIGKKFLIRGGMLAAISVALELLNQDDEDYKELDDYIKNGNLLIPLKEFGLKGQFLAIPKPFEAGLLFSTFPQQIVKTLNGDASTRDNANLFFQQMSSTFGVNPIPQTLLPAIEIITNHSFYTGLPLISEGKLRLAPELQYNTSTSQLAMMIGGLPIFYDFTTGRFGGMSPIVIDKLISGYGGPVGSYMAMAVGLGMQEAEMGPERMPIELSNAPVVRSFFIDAKSKNPKVVTEAYELFRVADEANRTVSRLKQMHDAEALHEYVDKNRDILTYKKYIFTLADRLNKLSAQERAVERSTTMTADEKIAAQQKLRDIRIRLASKVDEINKKLGR